MAQSLLFMGGISKDQTRRTSWLATRLFRTFISGICKIEHYFKANYKYILYSPLVLANSRRVSRMSNVGMAVLIFG